MADSGRPPRRWVVLRHELPPTAGRSSHWDLMVECGSSLLAWALDFLPLEDGVGTAVRLDDHRIEWIEREGAVSGGRGIASAVGRGVVVENDSVVVGLESRFGSPHASQGSGEAGGGPWIFILHQTWPRDQIVRVELRCREIESPGVHSGADRTSFVLQEGSSMSRGEEELRGGPGLPSGSVLLATSAVTPAPLRNSVD